MMVRLDPTHALELTIVDGSGLLLDARSATQAEQATRDPNLSLKDIFAFHSVDRARRRGSTGLDRNDM